MDVRDFLMLHAGNIIVHICNQTGRIKFTGTIFGARISDYKHYKVDRFEFNNDELFIKINEGE